jgi:hypothetical protein
MSGLREACECHDHREIPDRFVYQVAGPVAGCGVVQYEAGSWTRLPRLRRVPQLQHRTIQRNTLFSFWLAKPGKSEHRWVETVALAQLT